MGDSQGVVTLGVAGGAKCIFPIRGEGFLELERPKSRIRVTEIRIRVTEIRIRVTESRIRPKGRIRVTEIRIGLTESRIRVSGIFFVYA